MSLSITLTSEDTNKLIDTAHLLDLLFSTLDSNDTISISATADTSYNYTSEEIRELSSWYKNIVQVLRYNNYDVDLSNDEDYLASLTA
jgi:4-diphosphocytidyl-2C-methyl-D-erythritol kinase